MSTPELKLEIKIALQKPTDDDFPNNFQIQINFFPRIDQVKTVIGSSLKYGPLEFCRDLVDVCYLQLQPFIFSSTGIQLDSSEIAFSHALRFIR